MSGEQGKGRILWQQVDEASVLWSLNLQSFPEHKAAHRLLSPKARPSEAQLISRQGDGWQESKIPLLVSTSQTSRRRTRKWQEATVTSSSKGNSDQMKMSQWWFSSEMGPERRWNNFHPRDSQSSKRAWAMWSIFEVSPAWSRRLKLRPALHRPGGTNNPA